MNKRQLPSHWLEGPFRKVEHFYTLFKIALQCKWLSSPLYNYVQAPRDNLLPTGWMEGIYGKLTGEFVAITVIAITMASLCSVFMQEESNIDIVSVCLASSHMVCFVDNICLGIISGH